MSRYLRQHIQFIIASSIALLILTFEGHCGVTSFAPQVATIIPRKDGSSSYQQHSKCSTTTPLFLAKDEIDCTTGSRYLCLLNDYETVKGPYFSALFDELFEQASHTKKTMAFVTTQKDLHEMCSRFGERALNIRFANLRSSLDLDKFPMLFVMDHWHPGLLECRLPSLKQWLKYEEDRSLNPTIVWLYGNYNAFHTRHLLRTSGFRTR